MSSEIIQGVSIERTPLDLFLAPGEILSISAIASGTVSNFVVAMNWVEDI